MADCNALADDDESKDIKLQEVRLENPDTWNIYQKCDGRVKKTFDENKLQDKFLIDDGEFYVDKYWLDACNTLIED